MPDPICWCNRDFLTNKIQKVQLGKQTQTVRPSALDYSRAGCSQSMVTGCWTADILQSQPKCMFLLLPKVLLSKPAQYTTIFQFPATPKIRHSLTLMGTFHLNQTFLFPYFSHYCSFCCSNSSAAEWPYTAYTTVKCPCYTGHTVNNNYFVSVSFHF